MIQLIMAIVIILLIIQNYILYKYKFNQMNSEISELKSSLNEKEEEIEKLEKLDPLTEVLNRNRINSEIQMEFARIKRSHHPMGIILLGIDNLKQINREFSHSVGDYFLKDFSHLVKTSIRQTDIMGRWWSDQFVILYPQTDRETLIKIAEKLKLTIKESRFKVIGNVTVSMGLTTSMDNDDDEIKIIERATAALKIAKESGKDSISVY